MSDCINYKALNKRIKNNMRPTKNSLLISCMTMIISPRLPAVSSTTHSGLSFFKIQCWSSAWRVSITYHPTPFTNLQVDSDVVSIDSLRKNFKRKKGHEAVVGPDHYHLTTFMNLQVRSDLASVASLHKNFKKGLEIMVGPDDYNPAPFTNLQVDSDLASDTSVCKNLKKNTKSMWGKVGTP